MENSLGNRRSTKINWKGWPETCSLLAENPWLATARLGDDGPEGMSRTLLHVVTDWPGHFPNGAATVVATLGLADCVEEYFAATMGLPSWFGVVAAAGRRGPPEDAVNEPIGLPSGLLPEPVVMPALRIASALAHMAADLGEWWPVGAG